jgi:metal-responsive CopG/Arc/MetJ family transcriptional regulator
VSQIELSLPDETYTELEQLTEQEFVSQEQAVEELLRLGIESYDTTVVDDEEEFLEGAETNVFDTASDPGSLDDDAL